MLNLQTAHNILFDNYLYMQFNFIDKKIRAISTLNNDAYIVGRNTLFRTKDEMGL
jgi:hypothetical protein